MKLRKIYGVKCAYCESIWAGSSSPRVDHYRPKKYIKELEKDSHYGYYWLSLEWTNLIQSCESCNSKKSNYFPLKDESTRVNALWKESDIVASTSRPISGEPLKKESRLLLHPELDEVEKHLVFLRDGKIVPKGNSEMGSISIKRYGLNRGDLILQRKKKIDRVFSSIIEILNDYEDQGADEHALLFFKRDMMKLLKSLLQQQSEEEAYSRLGYYMFHEFEGFYIDRLPEELNEHKELLVNIYNNLI
ncbi:MAG: hypothetical protein ABJF04_25760 [Reichenbachiella sp.]|uniref:hypothetical protein n=1 Tax=Reichenbachiella sp. TaxID=2184521 RepID=UPI00326300CC